MDENDLRALQLTQQAVLRLVNEVSARAISKERSQELMTAQEAAQALRISRWRFYHIYATLGLKPVNRIGRKLLFRRSDLTGILEQPKTRRGRPPNRSKMESPQHLLDFGSLPSA